MKTLKIIQSVFLLFFGGVTLFLTSSIIFDAFGIREREGNYVLFIVYTNLICGLIYLVAAYANWKNKKYGIYALVFAALILVIAFISLLIYINNGGAYESKTVKAMLFRIALTITLVVTGLKFLKKSNDIKESAP